MASVILDGLLKDLRNAQRDGSVFGGFSVLTDEAEDNGGVEQIAVVVRFTTPAGVKEIFTGWVECPVTTGAAIKARVIAQLNSMSLNLGYLLGQGYDGAGNMAGRFKGVAALVQEDYPLAYFFHCAGHCLSLVLVHSGKIPLVRNCLDQLDSVYLFFDWPKRQKFLSVKCKDGYKMQGLCKVRWVIRCRALALFEIKLPGIIETLNAISENDHAFGGDAADNEGEWNFKTRGEASGLVKGISSFSFTLTLVVTLRCWRVTDGLCIALQAPALDVVAGYGYVDQVVERLRQMRVDIDAEFKVCYDVAVALAAQFDTEPSIPRRCGRQVHRDNVEAETPEVYYRRVVAVPILDNMLSEFAAKFANQKAIVCGGMLLVPARFVTEQNVDAWLNRVTAFASPAYDAFMPNPASLREDLRHWRRKFELMRQADVKCVLPQDAFSCLDHADNAMFRNVHVLLVIVCVFPLTTCTCERCNSALKRLKTRLRDMTTQRLTGLTLLNLYPAEEIDLEKVIDVFASRGDRRVDLVHPDYAPVPDLY